VNIPEPSHIDVFALIAQSRLFAEMSHTAPVRIMLSVDVVEQPRRAA
jgi:hypothetical protein